MKLLLQRKLKTNNSTIGELSIANIFFCYTLEDVIREGDKVDGKTAIPSGTYQVIIDDSKRFNRPMPHILDVPNFTGVRIHSGNTASDTEGCVLVGYKKDTDTIYESKAAFNDFMALLQKGLQEGKVTIDVMS